MESYPEILVLPYRLGADWLEQQVLSGHTVEPDSQLALNLNALDDPEDRELAVELASRIFVFDNVIEVAGSGISHNDAYRTPDGGVVRATDMVSSRIGNYPTFERPDLPVRDALRAADQWIKQYLELSRESLASWVDEVEAIRSIEEFSTIDPFVERIEWISSLGRSASATVSAKEDFQSFWTARRARRLLAIVREVAARDDFRAAEAIVGTRVAIPESSSEHVLLAERFLEFATRYFRIALSHMWTRERTSESFESEMARWANVFGSDRLNMGISDGYRMVPVYLEERIGKDAPGCFAGRAGKGKVEFVEKTAPTELALALSRSLYDRVSKGHISEGPVPEVRIVWVKSAPEAMCVPLDSRTEDGYWVDSYEGEFEALMIAGWLGTFDLLGVVDTYENPAPPYIRPEFVLKPDDYGIKRGQVAGPAAEDEVPF